MQKALIESLKSGRGKGWLPIQYFMNLYAQAAGDSKKAFFPQLMEFRSKYPDLCETRTRKQYDGLMQIEVRIL